MDTGPREHCGNAGTFVAGLMVGALSAALLRTMLAWRKDPNRPVRAMYNLIAPIYDIWAGERGPLAPLRQELVDLLRLEPGHRVLEVSVGTGANLPYLAAKVGPSGRLYRLDISEGMLAQAQRKISRLPCPVALQLGLAEDLPYASDSFDAVLHLGGINLFTDRQRALREMDRVARPGARVVVADETLPTDGESPIVRAILTALPRLRPPVALVPHPRPSVHRLGGGYIYALVWEKEQRKPRARRRPPGARRDG